MRIYSREDGESTWMPIAIIMTIVVVGMMVGYFAWYAPSQTVVAVPVKEVIVNTPAPTAPSTIVMPSTPGPAGETGATGERGRRGAEGPSGVKGEEGSEGREGREGKEGAEGAEGARGRTGDPGKTDDKGSGGQ